jgi:drug/metabolite transporter (DMT)-like permease
VGLAWGLLGAFLSALAYGTATVLQAMGAGTIEDTGEGVDPRLFIRVLGSLPFIIGLGLDAIGLATNLVALRALPLFAVQAIINTSLAVTALVAIPLLKVRLGRTDWIAIGVVILGLILVGVSAGQESPAHTGRGLHWIVLGAVLGLIAAALLVIWRFGGSPAVLGAFAGSLFGAFAVCVRILPDLKVTSLVTDPAFYALVIGALTGFLFFTTALQRGSVTLATAMLVVGETALPALLGLILFHDHTRDGFQVVAGLGFVCAVGGAIALSRFGEAAPAHATGSGDDPGDGDSDGDDSGSDPGDGSGQGVAAAPAASESSTPRR